MITQQINKKHKTVKNTESTKSTSLNDSDLIIIQPDVEYAELLSLLQQQQQQQSSSNTILKAYFQSANSSPLNSKQQAFLIIILLLILNFMVK